MAEKTRDEVVKTGKYAFIPWVSGIIGWLAIYLGCPGFLCSYGTLWLLIPFVSCLAWMIYGLVNSCKNPLLEVPGEDQAEPKKIEYERESFRWVSRYINNLILAITIVILATVFLGEIKNIFTPEWWPFFLFEFLALGMATGLILPFVWAGTHKQLVYLRHIKTVCFLYMIFFFLSGLIVLAQNVYNLIK